MRILMGVCLATMMSISFADTSMTIVENDGRGQNVQIKDGVLRSSNIGEDTGNSRDFMLYDSNTRTMTVVVHKNKNYSRIDEETMKQMGGTVSALQQQMEEQLKNLPPEQQAELRKMMGGLMSPDQAEQVRSETTAITGKVGVWACKIVYVFKGDEKVSEVCATDYKSLNIPEEDYLVMKDFFVFIANISENLPMAEQASFASADLGEGMFPVLIEVLKESATQQSMTLNKVSNESLEAALFGIPAGYKEQNLMEGMPQLQ